MEYSYYDLTHESGNGNKHGLETIFHSDGVYVRYYSNGIRNRDAHKTFYFSPTYSSEIQQILDTELHSQYKSEECVKALALHFDHWINAKISTDHLQEQFAKDALFDQLKHEAPTEHKYQMVFNDGEHGFTTHFEHA